jgi:hypothetical protein
MREVLDALGCPQQDPKAVQQDNSSTLIILERGYVTSRKTQHLATRAAFIKDKMEQGIISLKYTPTDHMIADILTKTVTGQQFIQQESFPTRQQCDAQALLLLEQRRAQ